MKRIAYVLFLTLALALAGCQPHEPEIVPSLSVQPTGLTFTAAGDASQTLTVTTNTKWSVSLEDGGSWCSLSRYAGEGDLTLTVTAARNTAAQARTTTLTFKAEKCADVTVRVNQEAGEEQKPAETTVTLSASPATWDGQKRADITYQLLVYSFADGDGDNYGDLTGVKEHIDYIDALGASAIWLSPINTSPSYHGYDVTDYKAVDPKLGTESDLKALIEAAHAKGIRVYMDYVLNHTSKDHPWFTAAASDAASPYRDWYIFSKDPKADVQAGRIPMIEKTGYNEGEWTSTSTAASAQNVRFTLTCDASDKPQTLKIEQVQAVGNSGTQTSGKYLWWGDSQCTEFYTDGSKTYTLSLALDSSWGVLVRTSKTTWEGGTKYGAPTGRNQLTWGEALTLSNTDAQNILLPGMEQAWYHSLFGSYMPDLNYGPVATCTASPAFAAVTEAADQWIRLGIDGFRLDAVKHIYHDSYSDENPRFLKAFYDHCNATFKAQGGQGEFYMVGEMYDGAARVAPYYAGLPAFFEFDFWNRLEWAINNATGCYLTKDLKGYRDAYAAVRSDFIEATKLTNHDENRAATVLGKSLPKEKLAAAVLLTAAGSPYIYQGEELGYWGVKDGGDEYVRTPVKWTRSGGAATGALGGKVDASMLSAAISVEAQDADEASLLNLYRAFARLRNTYPALASGEVLPHGTYNDSNTRMKAVSAWYRVSGSQQMLVVHNFGGTRLSASFGGEDLSRPVGLNGTVQLRTTASDQVLILDPYATVIFEQTR